ncbi:hypothetical protein DSM112329_00900 [Paraconexibacter sp. AEG42_29]|uniref:Metallo-beta-lactamase domain-containing protein n=1 Tax=Paraconexibacter sp. AEG42_29 TaxID=2997339 RepID=A0AAU7AQY8_9ACTN
MLKAAADAGIHRLVIPTPFGVGDVNCYLIEDDPLTLVDCGPSSAVALLALESELERLGHSLRDVQLLVITHQHIDHMGLAHVFASRGRAEIACLDKLAPVLENWEHHGAQDDDDALLLMRRHGVEDHVAVALRSVADIVRGWGVSCRVDRPLVPGRPLELAGRSLEVLHRPGHSPSDILLVDQEHRVAITGDHLLAGISSNAVISRPLVHKWDGRRPKTLLDYRESLRLTAELDVDVMLGGHRQPVTGHRELIAERLQEHERRAEKIFDKLAAGPRTAHELATETWGEVAVTQVFLTLSEILGHLDLLIDRGLVTEDRSADVIRFARAE